MYMYKEDLALNNQQRLIRDKLNPTKSYIFDVYAYVGREFGIK